MKLDVSREWLSKKLAHCDDANVGAGGTRFEDFQKDMRQRTVTPSALADVPTELGTVVRFVRERRGWSRAELADLADIDLADVEALETQANFDPKPRTVVKLADACHFSREKFIELAKHRLRPGANEERSIRFAASSSSTGSITDAEYEAIRALVEILSEGPSDEL